MAFLQMRPPNLGFANSLKADMPYTDVVGNSNAEVTTPLNYSSVQTLRNALNAANGTYYTLARLDTLSVNDMIFALRNMQDPTTIASYMTASSA